MTITKFSLAETPIWAPPPQDTRQCTAQGMIASLKYTVHRLLLAWQSCQSCRLNWSCDRMNLMGLRMNLQQSTAQT